MTTVTLTINGAEIVAEAGLTILEVARRADIHIPTLCHVPGKPADTPCQMCMVEIEGQEGLIRSCVGLAKDGMVISTDSPQVVAHRVERCPSWPRPTSVTARPLAISPVRARSMFRAISPMWARASMKRPCG